MSWHNAFHLEMKYGLVNDPNGLCRQDGKYQIFYQWNPDGCCHSNKHWGYVQTEDFIHYSKPRIALSPVDYFDKNGCYSGSARIKDGRMEIFYTANLKDEQNVRHPRQILAVKNPDGSFTKEKIIIDDVPQGYTAHFRDPYLFTHSGRSFMVLGAQRADLTGCCLIYEEIDSEWQLRGELITAYKDFGYMWECPNLITVDGTDVLLFCPQGLEAQGDDYNNLYQSGYIAGKFNPDTLEFTHGEFQELDRGFDFYAPQVLQYENRRILFGWIGMPEREHEYPTTSEGWIHSLTMPRELHCKDGVLYQEPVAEIAALCRDSAVYSNGDLDNLTLPRQAMLNLDIQLDSNAKLWQAELLFGSDILRLAYDVSTEKFCIDRSDMALGGKGQRRFSAKPIEGKLQLEIWLDTSVMEIYCQHGKVCATACYFPEQADTVPQLSIKNASAKSSLTVHALGSFDFAENM